MYREFDFIVDKRGVDLLNWLAAQKSSSRRIVATNGCFDILHAGHIHMLETAKKYGDILVVGINSDEAVKKLKGPQRPINNQQNRYTVLSALRCVNYVSVFDSTNAAQFLDLVAPDYYIKSSDYSLETLDKQELAVLQKHRTSIYFVDMVEGLSTSNIVKALK